MARDPHGFRPLAMGQLELSGGRHAYVFASETCAFDLIDAVYLNDVEPGEMVIVGPEGSDARALRSRDAALAVRVRARLLLAPGFDRLRPLGAGIARNDGPAAGPRVSRADADVVVPVPDSGVAAALGYSAESGIPFRHGADPQSLRRPHVHRALAGDPRLRREAEAESRSAICSKEECGAGGRFDRPRHHQPQDRPHGAQRRARAKCICASPVRRPFRPATTASTRRPSSELIAANHTVEEIRRFVEADSLGYLSLEALSQAVADEKNRLLLRLLHRRLSDADRPDRRTGERQGPPLMLCRRSPLPPCGFRIPASANSPRSRCRWRACYKLYFGESNIPTPEFIKRAAQKAMADGFTFYTENAGLPSLREGSRALLRRDARRVALTRPRTS